MRNLFKSRLFIIIIAAVMLLSLSGCALFDAYTAYSLYSNAAKKLKKAGGFEADCAITISFDILGNSLDQTINMNVKQNDKDSCITTSVLGQETTVTCIGDWVYTESGDLKVKYHNNKDDSKDDNDSASLNGQLPKLSKEIFDGIEVAKIDDGKKTITLSLDDETSAQLFKSFIGDELQESLSFKNIVFVFTFDKNKNLETMCATCDATVSVMEMSLGAKVTAEYTFVNFGTAPEIFTRYPESEYEDGGEYFQDESGIF